MRYSAAATGTGTGTVDVNAPARVERFQVPVDSRPCVATFQTRLAVDSLELSGPRLEDDITVPPRAG
jgi:hypothetical protein